MASYIVAWSDADDGILHTKCDSLPEAQGLLKSLFERNVKEEFKDSSLIHYLDEDNEVPMRDACSWEDDRKFRYQSIYWGKQGMSLEEDDMWLTEDAAYLRQNCEGERFEASIIPV